MCAEAWPGYHSKTQGFPGCLLGGPEDGWVSVGGKDEGAVVLRLGSQCADFQSWG